MRHYTVHVTTDDRYYVQECVSRATALDEYRRECDRNTYARVELRENGTLISARPATYLGSPVF